MDVIPKTYYISPEEHFQRMIIPSIPSCPHPPEHPEHLTIKTGVVIYRPDTEELKEIGLVITGYLMKTKCYSNWFGSCTETTTIDTPIDLDTLDPVKLQYVINSVRPQISKMKLNYPMMETFGESLTECSWLKTVEKSTKIIRYYTTEIDWSLRGYMLSPAVQTSCKRNKGSCSLGNSSRIFFEEFDKRTENITCKVKSLGNYLGLLTYDVKSIGPHLMNLTLHNFRSDKGLLFISLESKTPESLDLECFLGRTKVYSSPEGFIYSFMTHDGVEVIQNLLPSNSEVSDLIRPYKKTKRNTKSFVNHFNLNDFQPHYLLDSSDILPKRNLTRHIRSTVIDYPFSSRDLWYLEHSAWTTSEFESTIQTLTGETVQTMKHIWYTSCVNHYNNLILGRGIVQWSTIPFLRNYLDTSGFLSYFKEPYIYFKLGIPIIKLSLSDPPEFSSGLLKVMFRTIESEEKQGWLHPESGVVTTRTIMSQELDEVSPSSFLIPLLKKGSYDLFKKDIINTWEDLDVSRMEGKDFIFQTPYLDIQDNLENQRRTENAHSSLLIGAGSWLNSGSLFSTLTEHSDIGHFLDLIVMPAIFIIGSIIVIIIIIKVISLIILCLKPTSSKASFF